MDDDKEFQLEVAKLQIEGTMITQLTTPLISSFVSILMVLLVQGVYYEKYDENMPYLVVAGLFLVLTLVCSYLGEKSQNQKIKEIREKYIKKSKKSKS